jgi:hypothetical protein
MRPPEVFVGSLSHQEAVKLKRMSTRAEHQSTRIRATILLVGGISPFEGPFPLGHECVSVCFSSVTAVRRALAGHEVGRGPRPDPAPRPSRRPENRPAGRATVE